MALPVPDSPPLIPVGGPLITAPLLRPTDSAEWGYRYEGLMMNRREWLKATLTLPLVPLLASPVFSAAKAATSALSGLYSRVRPGQPGWPSPVQWGRLNQAVGGRLQRVRSPFEGCATNDAACQEALAQIKNPYYIGDHVG